MSQQIPMVFFPIPDLKHTHQPSAASIENIILEMPLLLVRQVAPPRTEETPASAEVVMMAVLTPRQCLSK
jgi:hypothetical protein